MSKFNAKYIVINDSFNGKLVMVNNKFFENEKYKTLPKQVAAYYKNSFEKYIKEMCENNLGYAMDPNRDFFYINPKEKYIFLVVDQITIVKEKFLGVIYRNNVVYINKKFLKEINYAKK